jgi:hypothetical protein
LLSQELPWLTLAVVQIALWHEKEIENVRENAKLRLYEPENEALAALSR